MKQLWETGCCFLLLFCFVYFFREMGTRGVLNPEGWGFGERRGAETSNEGSARVPEEQQASGGARLVMGTPATSPEVERRGIRVEMGKKVPFVLRLDRLIR